MVSAGHRLQHTGAQSAYLLTLALVGGSLLISSVPGIDLWAAGRFACPGQEPPWCHRSAQPWEWLYRWGPIPGVGSGIIGILLLLAGTVRHRTRQRAAGFFLAVTLLLGPGILGNSIKPLWGRPRPRHMVQFGGNEQYRPVWALRPGGRGTSFPSGHVVTAFSLGALSLLPAGALARTALLAGSLLYGTLMGLARMAQGAHFITDVVWSATLAWIAILLSARITLPRPPPTVSRP